MDTYYEPIHRRVKDLQFRYHDVLDRPEHPAARLIRKEMRNLQTEIEMGKSPRSIEGKLKMVQNQIHQAERSGYGIMSPHDSYQFHHDFDHLNQDIRKLPHY